MNFKKTGMIPFMHITRTAAVAAGHLPTTSLREAGLPWLVAVTNNGFSYTYAYEPEVRVVKRRSANLAAARSAA